MDLYKRLAGETEAREALGRGHVVVDVREHGQLAEGVEVQAAQTLELSQQLLALGAQGVAISDTIGKATPEEVRVLLLLEVGNRLHQILRPCVGLGRKELE